MDSNESLLVDATMCSSSEKHDVTIDIVCSRSKLQHFVACQACFKSVASASFQHVLIRLLVFSSVTHGVAENRPTGKAEN